MNEAAHNKAEANVKKVKYIRAYLSHEEREFSLEDFTKESLQTIYAAMDRARSEDENDQHA